MSRLSKMKPEDVHRKIVKTAQEASDLIKSRIYMFNAKERWLVYGRILNYLFSSFYGTSIREVESKLERAAKNEATRKTK